MEEVKKRVMSRVEALREEAAEQEDSIDEASIVDLAGRLVIELVSFNVLKYPLISWTQQKQKFYNDLSLLSLPTMTLLKLTSHLRV